MPAFTRVCDLSEGESFFYRKNRYEVIAIVLETGERVTKCDYGNGVIRKEIWYDGSIVVS